MDSKKRKKRKAVDSTTDKIHSDSVSNEKNSDPDISENKKIKTGITNSENESSPPCKLENQSIREPSSASIHEDVKDLMIKLPKGINIMKFSEARASEIAFLTEVVETKGPKLYHQQLPRHMRRRAASHNPNRLPRRLRMKAMRELDKVKKTKRPSRKHRRRPSNLLQEYNRRQRDKVWLETHIWFAKRFKMTELWGYKLPMHSYDKTLRACYRASVHYALLQDVSYYGCIELSGKEQFLLKQLAQLTSAEIGLTFQARVFLSGSREGTVMVFHHNSYPYGLIGPVKFLWKPQLENMTMEDKQKRCIWLWTHPSCYNELVEELKSLFDLKKVRNENENIFLDEASKNKEEDLPKTKPLKKDKNKKLRNDTELKYDDKHKKHFERVQVYNNEEIAMVILKDVLVRHRLIGSLSQGVLSNALEIANIEPGISDESSSSENLKTKWWKRVYSIQSSCDLLQRKKEIWEKLKNINSATQIPSGTVFGLTVLDPRLRLPTVKNQLYTQSCNAETFSSSVNILPSTELAYSHIWDSDIRDEVTSTKITEAALNDMRSKQHIPGTPLELGENESRIPLLVIQQPGNDKGYGGGMDVIIPAGWSMAFWLAFIYRRARPAGLREVKSTGLEGGVPVFPCDFPDSLSGKNISETRRLDLITKHYRYPPDKRPSFKKLGILIPFFSPWTELIQEWIEIFDKKHNGENDNAALMNDDSLKNYFVLRNKSYLKKLASSFSYKTNENAKVKIDMLNGGEEFISLLNSPDTAYLQNALIFVRLTAVFRGTPGEFSAICIPIETDLKMLKENLHYEGPKEPIHKFKKEQKIKKSKKKKSDKSNEENKKISLNTPNEKLQKPEVKELLNSSSRKVIGFIQSGGFSLLKSCGYAVGHCSLIGLLELLQFCFHHSSEPFVLTKKQDCFQYRFARIEIAIV